MIIAVLLGVAISAGCINGSPRLPPKPDCNDICNHMISKNEYNFTMSLWNVVCQDKVCVVKSEKYLKYEVPKATTVHFDIDLLNVTQIKFKEDTMCLALRLGMCWKDTGLDMCNCRDDQEDFSIHINMDGHIWIPDVTMYPLKAAERLKILKPVGRLLLEKTNGTTIVYLSMDLRATIICSFNPSSYPFDRNICYVRVGSYSHTRKMLSFVKKSIPAKNITRRDVQIYVRELCKEKISDGKNGEVLDGFQIILIRKGHEVKNKYAFVMHLCMVTAALSLLLPGNPRHIAIDKSELLIGVVISAYYILFDLQAQTPIDKTGNNLLTRFFKHSNNLLCIALLIYFLEIYVIRFGFSTMMFCKYYWAKFTERNMNFELVRDEKFENRINNAWSIANKVFFMMLMISYCMLDNYYWITAENSAISSIVHNRAIGDCADLPESESHPPAGLDAKDANSRGI